MGPGTFRLLLSAIVVIGHFSSLALGKAAVFLFFVLSGFWVVRMWRDRYRHADRPFQTFMLSRLMRLLPTFIVVNVAAFALGPVALPSGLAEWIPNIALVGYASLSPGRAALTPAWSLDIELQFYVLIPLLAALLWEGNRTLALSAMALAAGFGLWHLLGVPDGIAPSAADYLAFFFAGMIAARFEYRPSRSLCAVAAFVAAISVALIVAMPDLRGVLIGGAKRGPLFEYNMTANIGLALALIPVALWTVWRSSSATDRAAGDLSYVVYLVHWVGFQWVNAHYGALPALARLPYVAAALGIVAMTSVVLWLVFDRPINRMRAAFVAKRLGRRQVQALAH